MDASSVYRDDAGVRLDRLREEERDEERDADRERDREWRRDAGEEERERDRDRRRDCLWLRVGVGDCDRDVDVDVDRDLDDCLDRDLDRCRDSFRSDSIESILILSSTFCKPPMLRDLYIALLPS